MNKKMKEPPKIQFFCLQCNLFFDVNDGTPFDDVKCPDCGTYEVFIELEFSKEAPTYIS